MQRRSQEPSTRKSSPRPDVDDHRQAERRVLRHALAWFIVVFGLLLAGREVVTTDLLPAADPDEGYLSAVLRRAMGDLYRLALLAGWGALVPHALILTIAWRNEATRAGYASFAAWVQVLFTSLGFLGTIVGVSLAVAGLPTAMQADDPAALITGLSTAFDTTFLGLGAAITVMLLRKLIELAGR